jgi:diazepam-binding inhibitor (GABA receptor modulating acyl-CoA-binding protein)
MNYKDPKFLDQCFEKAQQELFDLPRCDNDDKLKIYGLYKQATVGDNTGSEPYSWNVRNHAKWIAWNNYTGLSCDVAKREYCNTVDKLQKKYNN